jgi:septin family protein
MTENFDWCKPPFNMMVCGMTDCGKTHFIVDLLEREFASQFHDIVLFCPTVEFNQTYIDRHWVSKDSKIYRSSQ